MSWEKTRVSPIVRQFAVGKLVMALAVLASGCFAVLPTPTPTGNHEIKVANLQPTIDSLVEATIEARPNPTEALPSPPLPPTPTSTPEPPAATPVPASTQFPTATSVPTANPTTASKVVPTQSEQSEVPIQFAPFTSRFEEDIPYYNDQGLRVDETGAPIFRLVLLNTSRKAIDALEFAICPRNAFDDPVQDGRGGEVCVVRISNVLIEPIEVNPRSYLPLTKYSWSKFSSSGLSGGRELEWRLEGFESVARVQVTLTRIHFMDGSTWSTEQSPQP